MPGRRGVSLSSTHRDGHATDGNHATRNTHAPLRVGFRQLFEPESSTYSYLLFDEGDEHGAAVIIDPCLATVERDLELVQDLGLTLLYGVNTHCHADHITATGAIKRRLGSTFKSVISKDAGAQADMLVGQGSMLTFGRHMLEVRATPGHTAGCLTYVSHDLGAAFTGDALLIRACGRTDFQAGSASTLYDSITGQIFSLPRDYLVYPGHDYHGRMSSSVGEERDHNPRIKDGTTRASFVQTMANLKLAYPKQIDKAIPANLKDGALSRDAAATAL